VFRARRKATFRSRVPGVDVASIASADLGSETFTGTMVGRMRRSAGAAALVGLLALAPLSVGAGSEQSRLVSAAADMTALLARVGERVEQYYDRVTSVVCIETVSQQELRFNLKPQGKPRETVYELMVVRQPPANGEAESHVQIERRIKSINGRPVRKAEPPGCTDPRSVTVEPLTFLLPKYQPMYRFSRATDVEAGGPPDSVVVDFQQIHKDPIEVRWDGLCFDAKGGGMDGRIWLEAGTHDVLRLDIRLTEAYRVPPPPGLGSEILPIRVERSEITIRFARVGFQNPEETMLLPESMVTLTVFRGVPSLRTTQTFSAFKRFMSEASIKGAV
jgi:hypothetical protein